MNILRSALLILLIQPALSLCMEQKVRTPCLKRPAVLKTGTCCGVLLFFAGAISQFIDQGEQKPPQAHIVQCMEVYIDSCGKCTEGIYATQVCPFDVTDPLIAQDIRALCPSSMTIHVKNDTQCSTNSPKGHCNSKGEMLGKIHETCYPQDTVNAKKIAPIRAAYQAKMQAFKQKRASKKS